MGADQSFALPFYEKLAMHYAHSRQSDAQSHPQIYGQQAASWMICKQQHVTTHSSSQLHTR